MRTIIFNYLVAFIKFWVKKLLQVLLQMCDTVGEDFGA